MPPGGFETPAVGDIYARQSVDIAVTGWHEVVALGLWSPEQHACVEAGWQFLQQSLARGAQIFRQ